MKYVLGFILSFFLWGTCQAEIVSVISETAELRSKPSPTNSYVVMQVPRYYPLSVQASRGDYYEVRDFQDHRGWIHKSMVDHSRSVVVEVDRMNVRKGPGTNYPVTFHAYQGVVFRVMGEKGLWLEVEHEDGERGWVSSSLTWGQ
ncbi:SH3 domain-containing protein [Desulfuromonas sp.]|uniref:SH3 domain-containing protein n=1 Tax=Desulfuromonas sp. TaxID=892 RepID=UPI0025BD2C40|nr:SH3 domain-containing protein [Desulfuromonas sp.]